MPPNRAMSIRFVIAAGSSPRSAAPPHAEVSRLQHQESPGREFPPGALRFVHIVCLCDQLGMPPT